MSDKTTKSRRLTRQGVREQKDADEKREQPRRSTQHSSHSPGNPEHAKKCFLCSSSADSETPQTKRPAPRTRKSSTSSRGSNQSRSATPSRASPPPKPQPSATVTSETDVADNVSTVSTAAYSKSLALSPSSDFTVTFDSGAEWKEADDSEEDIFLKTPFQGHKLPGVSSDKDTFTAQKEITVAVAAVSSPDPILLTSSSHVEDLPPATLASTGKTSTAPPKSSTPAQPPASTPSKPAAPAHTNQQPAIKVPQTHTMTSTGGPMTRLQAQSVPALDGGHRQVAASFVDEGTLDQTFQITPKWHYVKSNHDETGAWLDSASSDSILLELLYFAHDQGHIQQKELEGQFEKELQRAISSIDKLECLDAFCQTFIRDGRFRPAGKVQASSNKDEKYNRLFRMINADLLNLQRQQRILSMVCTGTADHEVHTQAHRENLRKLVEDLVHIVHPGDRGTLSEVYKFLTENAVYNERIIKPALTSLKLVCTPDIVVPYGGPIVAGGMPIKCDTLEHKIRSKLPSLLIKMHFSDRAQDQKWPDFNKPDDSGLSASMDVTIGNDDPSLPSGTSTPTGTGSSRPKGGKPDDKSAKGGSASRSSKRKQPDETPPSKSKRHREEINSGGYDTQPPEAHVINEIYSEHVSQLLCSLAQSPKGFVKHCRYPVGALDERDGTASVSALGMIVSGEDVYLTKLDASQDYLDSLVETFRMDQLSFSCMANPLNLYKGTHLKALLMFLRYVCLNFPRTTYFMSE